MFDVNGKTAVVTGAASGIGRGMAWAFAGAGMSVVLSDLDADRLGDTTAALRDAGHQVHAVVTNVSDQAQVEALAAEAVDTFGSVHVLCNNAGVGIGGAIDEMSLDDWKFTLDVDLWSVLYGVRAFLPLFKEQGEGHINATSSVAGLLCGPTLGAYHVAKFGVVALMDTLRVELADSPVNASVLCPGPINTTIVESSQRHRPDPAADLGGESHFMENLSSTLAEGMDPAEVGDLVLDAIVNERFWVLTHPEWFLPVLQKRVDQMAADHAHRMP